MTLSGPNQLWAADVAYIRLADEFVYLAAVLDVFCRKVVGWALDRVSEHSFPSTLWSEPLPIGVHRLELFTVQIGECSKLAGIRRKTTTLWNAAEYEQTREPI